MAIKKKMAGLAAAAAMMAGAAEFFVAPGGIDATGDGTAGKPFASVERARDALRGVKDKEKVITLKAGDYYLRETLRFGAEDSGVTLRGEKAGAATLHGGTPITGWRRDGGEFWAADLPEVKEGKWDFRALSVEGKPAVRACYPGVTNRLDNLGQWKVRLLPALAGWWERKPTHEELTQMPYRRGDLPDGMETKNAEVRLYHMWNESLVGVASNDTEKCVLHLASPALWPMGACGRRQYVVYNIREGLTEPGQWYLDRAAGKVVYWPRKGEDVAKLRVVAPRTSTILRIAGTSGKPVRGMRVEGLNFETTTPPMRKATFGGGGLPGAVEAAHTEGCVLEGLRVRNTGGMGVALNEFRDSALRGCEVSHTGARAVGVSGRGAEVSGTRIHDVGLIFPSSCGLGAGGAGLKILRNEVYNVPYSGMIVGGEGHEVAENLIYRVMQTLHDGAAIYGNISHSVIRGNVVRDVVPNGKGFGASAYYIDEGGVGTLVEGNVSEGVSRPVHFHITRDITVRNNTFIHGGDMTVSFQKSVGGRFSGNTLVTGGELKMSFPNGVVEWESNKVFKARDPKRPELGHEIGNFAPENPELPAKKHAVKAHWLTGAAPVLDGEAKHGEWPGEWAFIDRDATSRQMGGSPAMLRAAHDGTNLYVVVSATTFRNGKVSGGHEWGVDDGVEISFGGGRRIRAWADGTVEAGDAGLKAALAGAYAGPAKNYRGLGKMQNYAVKVRMAEIGAGEGRRKVPFNVKTWSSEWKEARHWEAKGDGQIWFEWK